MGLRRTFKKIFNKKQKKTEAYIRNAYHTNYTRKVLVSYITTPYLAENSFTHQNYDTAHLIGEVFSELGYCVDVIEFCEQDIAVDYGEYELIFGFGYHLEQSFYHPNRSIQRIHFITGAHELLQDKMSLQGVKDFFNISGLWLPHESKVRTDRTYYSDFDSDFVIIFAYGFVYDDYKKRFKRNVYSLNNNILGAFSEFKIKKAEDRNKNFLFLSGTKLVAKGLFILMEVARLRKDLSFHVVVFHLDEALNHYYEDLFKEGTNVFLHKSLRMNSAEMRAVVENCSYCLGPSYIDGLPGGVIEPMSAGLIPVVSKYCGFPSKEFIFELDELSPSGLSKGIDEVLELDDLTYIKYSNAVREYARIDFSLVNVKRQLTEILSSELSGT